MTIVFKQLKCLKFNIYELKWHWVKSRIVSYLEHTFGTLTQKLCFKFYRTLLRIDFILLKISTSNLVKLQANQNTALRIIYKKDRLYSLSVLHEKASLETRKIRAKIMIKKIFDWCFDQFKPYYQLFDKRI